MRRKTTDVSKKPHTICRQEFDKVKKKENEKILANTSASFDVSSLHASLVVSSLGAETVLQLK